MPLLTFMDIQLGGTNPSLLEALGSTRVNLLYGIGFNREVARDSALYWSKDKDSLSHLINRVDNLPMQDKEKLSKKAKNVISNRFSWNQIIANYESLFLEY